MSRYLESCVAELLEKLNSNCTEPFSLLKVFTCSENRKLLVFLSYYGLDVNPTFPL